MKIFVMGAGYVGMALIHRLHNSHQLYISTTNPNKVKELSIYSKEVIILNSAESNDLSRLIDICDAMVILVAPKHNASYKETYLDTAKLVSTALQKRLKPFYLLYTSSTSVYENLKEEWANEESDLEPSSNNAQILLDAEKIYLNCPVKTCILRLGGIYGPDRELSQRAQRFSNVEMSSNGNEPTNHIHLEDIVSALEFCLNNQPVGIYNLVNNDHPSRRQLYSEICHSLQLPLPQWKSPDRITRASGYKVSNEKILRTGFQLKHSSFHDL